MGEEPGLMLVNSFQPGSCLPELASLSFEFLHDPSSDVLVDTPGNEVQLGAVEGPVVADPASHLRIDLHSEAGQVRPAPTIEMPAPDPLADRLPRLAADGRVLSATPPEGERVAVS